MGEQKQAFATLRGFLEAAIEEFPDRRQGTNTHYRIRDAALSGFSVFFIQCPSFLVHQDLMQRSKGINNARTIFGVHWIPSDAQIRNLLDPVSPEQCSPVFEKVCWWLQEQGVLEREYRSMLDSYWVALDGTWFHSSECIPCPQCLYKDHRDGRRQYYHSAITPVFVRPGTNRVLALEPEFLRPQDGQEKQGCETNAAKRWIAGAALKYVGLGRTLLGDDLYCKHPFCNEVLERGYHFLFTCKSSSHKYWYEWINPSNPPCSTPHPPNWSFPALHPLIGS